uniref:SEC11 homolog C, signal peptidase complex subunit n=1 Tax=Oryctolagus cuniculus TaxID=9986 RepID=A0A5F9CKK8_RABIT
MKQAEQLYYQVLNFAMIVSSALMIWKGLIVLTGSESPIVVVLRDNGDIKFLTKGDNNEVDDRGLYKEGQNWLEKKDVVGRARGFLPYVGMVTIIMNDYPKFKVGICVSVFVRVLSVGAFPGGAAELQSSSSVLPLVLLQSLCSEPKISVST